MKSKMNVRRLRSRAPRLESLESRRLLTILPPGLVEQSIGFVDSPTTMTVAPDGRLFVGSQGGQIYVVENDDIVDSPFLDIPVDDDFERGLLGIAFDPAFEVNNAYYVYYTTTTTPAHNRVSRFTANGNTTDPATEEVILELNALSAGNHNAGAIHFGPDGMLYVATGDNAVASNSQTLDNLLGKILRIHPDGTIPTDNPFYNEAEGVNRAIWAMGLRNPFAFAFQPGTGRMHINDVGQSSWEEINLGIAGANYGWPAHEGEGGAPQFEDPLYAYPHDGPEPTGCSITGGTFYNPDFNQLGPQYTDGYFFADYCNDWIYYYDYESDTIHEFADLERAFAGTVDVEAHPDGSLYYLNGQLMKITAVSVQPRILEQPSAALVAVGQPATFMVNAAGVPAPTFQWQRDGADIAGANDASYQIGTTTLADSGAEFQVVVSNLAGSVVSDAALLTVVDSEPPEPIIDEPVADLTYDAGTTYRFSGRGMDAEDGQLAAESLTWEIVFHHDDHTHPFFPPVSGVDEGTFTIPTTGETSANVWYRVHLTVEDSDGLRRSTFRDVHPNTSFITLDTNPSGLEITLDGQPYMAPHTVESVVGVERSLGVVSPQQTGSGDVFAFTSWSDQGADSHVINTPSADATYQANFALVGSELVSEGAAWRYLDDGSDQGTAWRDFGFDDSQWEEGAAQLGYGDVQTTVISFGGVADDKHATTYFRHAFDFPRSPAGITTLELGLLRDDGAAVYLNGEEIARDNLAADAAFDDFASGPGVPVGGDDEETFHPFTIDLGTLPAGTLREGRNELAVEVHQGNATSSDLGFDLRLSAVGVPADTPPVVLDVTVNAGQLDPNDRPDAGAQPASWGSQRSEIRDIRVAFDQPVLLTASDLVLTNLGVNAPADADQQIPLTSDNLSLDGSELTVTFENIELADGVYQLELLTTVTSIQGEPMAMPFLLTGSRDNGLSKLEADWSGDGGVSIFDFPVLSYWFGETVPAAPAYVDTNRDMGISIFDFTSLAENFGGALVYPPLARSTPEINSSNSPRNDHALLEVLDDAELFWWTDRHATQLRQTE